MIDNVIRKPATIAGRLGSKDTRPLPDVNERGRHRPARRVEHDAVDKAPSPIFPRFVRSENGMRRSMEVRRGVTVLRVVATSDVTTDHAQSQVHPCIARSEAILAPACTGSNVVDLVHVRAVAHHSFTFPISTWRIESPSQLKVGPITRRRSFEAARINGEGPHIMAGQNSRRKRSVGRDRDTHQIERGLPEGIWD